MDSVLNLESPSAAELPSELLHVCPFFWCHWDEYDLAEDLVFDVPSHLSKAVVTDDDPVTRMLAVFRGHTSFTPLNPRPQYDKWNTVNFQTRIPQKYMKFRMTKSFWF